MILDSTYRRANCKTNKINIITLHQGKSAKTTILRKNLIMSYIFLGNAVTSNKVILTLWSMNYTFGKNLRIHFKMVISFYENTFFYS